MQVAFLHGPAASGKHTVGKALSRLTGLPLFHNHFAVDAALSLFPFGDPSFLRLRAGIWQTAFEEAARRGQGFIFTFQPEATVDPGLIPALCRPVEAAGGQVHFVRLTCPREAIMDRLGSPDRKAFGKLTDPALYEQLERQGAFAFPDLPTPRLILDTGELSPEAAAQRIASTLGLGPATP